MIATALPRDDRPHPRVSVVVPCFNEEEVIAETVRRLGVACRDAVGDDYEIVFIDDGSRDRTWPLLQGIAQADPNVVALSLSRNFGHQLALSAGLQLCRGERILVIDADLQDPPELLKPMMAVMDEGADVVYGQRTERQGETAFKTGSASLFYRLLNKLTDVDIPENVGDFRLVTRPVLDALLALPEQHRFVRGLVAWLGFRQVAFPYVRAERFAGVTKYPLRKMLRLAVDAITGFSVVPLRISIWAALACFRCRDHGDGLRPRVVAVLRRGARLGQPHGIARAVRRRATALPRHPRRVRRPHVHGVQAPAALHRARDRHGAAHP